MQDVHASVEGLIAIVQSRGDREVSADVSLLRTGVLDGDHLVHIVLGNRHTILVLLALGRADDGVQLLALLKRHKAVLAALLLNQVDADVTNSEGVGSVLGISEISQGAADDHGCDQHDAGHNKSKLLLHVVLSLNNVYVKGFVR